MSINRSEIRKVVRELIKETLVKEGWIDFLKGRKKIPLATDIKKWCKEHLDFRGVYKGPRIPGFTLVGVFIRNPIDPDYLEELQYNKRDVEIIHYWNTDVAKQEGYSEEKVDEAKKALLNNLEMMKSKIKWTDLKGKYDRYEKSL